RACREAAERCAYAHELSFENVGRFCKSPGRFAKSSYEFSEPALCLVYRLAQPLAKRLPRRFWSQADECCADPLIALAQPGDVNPGIGHQLDHLRALVILHLDVAQTSGQHGGWFALFHGGPDEPGWGQQKAGVAR